MAIRVVQGGAKRDDTDDDIDKPCKINITLR